MKARVIATGEIIEVEFVNTYRFNDGSFVEVFRDPNTDTLCFGRDLAFDIEGKFTENCLNGIKQDIVHDPYYWTRLEHQAAIAAMQGLVTRGEVLGSSTQAIARDIAEISCEVAHALVEKYKKEEQL